MTDNLKCYFFGEFGFSYKIISSHINFKSREGILGTSGLPTSVVNYLLYLGLQISPVWLSFCRWHG